VNRRRSLVTSAFSAIMSTNGNFFQFGDENMSSLKGKRCQLKKSFQRGVIIDVTSSAKRTKVMVDLDKDDVTITLSVESIYIADNINKYPPYPISTQRGDGCYEHFEDYRW